MDYFDVFGLPRTLAIDPVMLETTFHNLSRKYHPDYFTTAPQADRLQAVRMTALINDAYRTLRNPIRRVEYLLALEGFKPDGSKVPQALLMEVFEINEQMEEFKAGRASIEQVDSLKAQVREKREQFDAELQQASDEWDALLKTKAPAPKLKVQLAKLTEIVSESSYIRNLERDLGASSFE
jgi:molecular chaperone HscB